jgi:hypothetical protein
MENLELVRILFSRESSLEGKCMNFSELVLFDWFLRIDCNFHLDSEFYKRISCFPVFPRQFQRFIPNFDKEP